MKKCVLFIHGLTGSKDETWGDLDKKLNEIKNNSKDNNFNLIDFKYFDYESSKLIDLEGFTKSILTSLFQKISSSDKNIPLRINNISSRLRTYLSGEEFSDYKKISIISHSMGGLIAAKYLLDEIEKKRELRVDKILYICTPFVGSIYADMASKIGLPSYEVKEMKQNSDLLKEIATGSKKIEDKVDSTYFFGESDDIIEDYKNKIDEGLQGTLKGGHKSILKEENLRYNYKYIEYFILKSKENSLIDNLYLKAQENNFFYYDNRYKRKIKTEECQNSIQMNNLVDVLLINKEKETYKKMMSLINHHHFNPHERYNGESYYVKIDYNEKMLDDYWRKIVSMDKLPVYFYVGSRGSGKTLLQNIWIKKHYYEMEDKKIFHVRCDVHKMYSAMRNSKYKKEYKELKIDEYIDMQFLYIFLKYRDSQYNDKGVNREGVCSTLMKNIYNEIDKSDEEIVSGSKFDNLGDFLDQQSRNIKHNEVNLRPNNRKYSYAIDLMGNIYSNNIIEKIVAGYNQLEEVILDGGEYEPINVFLGTLDSAEQNEAKNNIKSVVISNKDEDFQLKEADIRSNLLRIDKKIKEVNKKTTKIWLDVSHQIQKIITLKKYKILKIIDGIDNIIISNDDREKEFYEGKVEEINKIAGSEPRSFVYYFISLRNDSFIRMEAKWSYSLGNVDEKNRKQYVKYVHENAEEMISDIMLKRYEALETLQPYLDKKCLYYFILNYLFKKKNHHSTNITNFSNIRTALRHYMFLSLHVLLEFKRKRINKFDSIKCDRVVEEMFNQVFFLRDRLYIDTKGVAGTSSDSKYKVFPNLFYAKKGKNNQWLGLCRIRILQLLQGRSMSRTTIVEILENIYTDKEHIENKIDNLFDHNLIETDMEVEVEEKVMKYRITNKGIYLLEIIKSDLNIIYYMCLDAFLPEKYVNGSEYYSSNSCLGVFKSKITDYKNIGYGNSIIKSVLTFSLFIKNVHNLEVNKINNRRVNDIDIERITLPINISDIDKGLSSIYREVIKDYEILHNYFKYVGSYDSEVDLERDLINFSWKN